MQLACSLSRSPQQECEILHLDSVTANCFRVLVLSDLTFWDFCVALNPHADYGRNLRPSTFLLRKETNLLACGFD